MSLDPETKQYLELLFAGSRQDVKRVAEAIRDLQTEMREQRSSIHTIEVNTTTRLSKMELDLQHLWERSHAIEKNMQVEEDGRVQSDISLGKRIAEFETAYNLDQLTQAGENQSNRITRKVIYWLVGIIGVEIVLLLWQIFIGEISLKF